MESSTQRGSCKRAFIMEIFGQDADQDKNMAAAKDGQWVAAAFGLPKRMNPLDVLLETSVACLTRIAENSSIPSSLLEQLALHPDATVREAVADNANTPLDVLWVLAGDQCPEIRYAMAENHNLPEVILSALCLDENPYISSLAQATINRIKGATLVNGHFPAQGAGDRVANLG